MEVVFNSVIVLLALVSLTMNQDVTNCPSSCSCSSVDSSTEGFCRGCPTGSTPSVALKVKCDSAGFSNIPQNVLPGVSWLDMSKNNITQLDPKSLAQLSALIHLKLSQNNVQTIHEGVFQDTKTLQILDLDLNNLTVLGRTTFAGAETLIHLDLSGNRLESVDNAFAGLSELSRLDLRNNRLTQLTQHTFRGLSSLRYLLLTSNRIYYVDRRAFRPLEKLVYIVLKGNPIGDQTLRFQFHSSFLTYVDVSECGFAQVPKGLPGSARYLQLRRNNLTALTRNSFVECPYITILVLDENRIESIENRTFEHMTQLQQLWLNNNRLMKVPGPLPVAVERLLMDLNRVEEISRGSFPQSSQINTLSLMGNNITQVSPGAFDPLQKLKSLDLSNNKLRRIHGQSFANLGQLKVLQLSSNNIQNFDPGCFRGLTSVVTFSLAYVTAEKPSVDEKVFDDMTLLSRLDLDSSPGLVSALVTSDRLLTSLGKVQELSMRSSDLAHLRSDVFQFLPNLTTFRLSSTRWSCDRNLIWLRDWMTSTTIKLDDSEENRCATPRSLHGRSLLSLDTDEFAAGSDHIPTANIRDTDYSSLPDESTPLPPSPGPPVSINPLTSARPFHRGIHLDHLGPEEIDIDSIYDQTSKLLPPPHPPSGSDWQYGEPENDTDIQFTESEVSDASRKPETNPKTSETKTTTQNGSERNRPAVSYNRSTLAIVIATVAATLVIAIVILGIIVHLTNDKRSRRTRNAKSEVPPKSIPYKHKNGILYYTTSSAKSDSTTPDLISKTASGEVMTLIPGRDFNHEGPMRVYKWEDF